MQYLSHFNLAIHYHKLAQEHRIFHGVNSIKAEFDLSKQCQNNVDFCLVVISFQIVKNLVFLVFLTRPVKVVKFK